jgi:hypothetical protein
VSQVALTLALLVGAGLMIRTFAALRSIDPGFDPEDVVTMKVSLAGSSQAAPARRIGFYEEFVREVEAQPDVTSASIINHLPLAGDTWNMPYAVEGRPAPAPGEESSGERAPGPHPVAGAGPDRQAHRHRSTGRWLTVVGVAKDARQASWSAPSESEV